MATRAASHAAGSVAPARRHDAARETAVLRKKNGDLMRTARKTLTLSFSAGLLIAGSVLAGDAAADKAKAKQLREKANKLWTDANKDHEKSVADFDAAVAFQEKADKDRAEARK